MKQNGRLCIFIKLVLTIPGLAKNEPQYFSYTASGNENIAPTTVKVISLCSKVETIQILYPAILLEESLECRKQGNMYKDVFYNIIYKYWMTENYSNIGNT